MLDEYSDAQLGRGVVVGPLKVAGPGREQGVLDEADPGSWRQTTPPTFTVILELCVRDPLVPVSVRL